MKGDAHSLLPLWLVMLAVRHQQPMVVHSHFQNVTSHVHPAYNQHLQHHPPNSSLAHDIE
jgi:hypothetical protein